MKKIANVPVQLKELEIFNFKNVGCGKLTFIKSGEKSKNENIMALYGPNGSGKTTLVNALEILKCYMTNEPFTNEKMAEFLDYFSIKENSSKIKSKFLVRIEKKIYNINYDIEFIKDVANKNFNIKKERIGYVAEDNTKIFMEHTSKGYRFSDNISESINKISDTLKAAEKISLQTKQSYIFNSFFIADFIKTNPDILLSRILEYLQMFSRLNMFVITNKQFGMINLQWNLPFMFRLSKNKGTTNEKDEFVGQEEITSGGQCIDLKKPQIVTVKFYQDLEKMFSIINEVLIRIIPGTQIGIIANQCILPNGEKGMAIELVTIKNEKYIPMRNESTGIMKIISIIQTLITYCIYDDIFLAIDELDAGIFELLLGRLLELLSKEGKGQLFFTSHNLRPLEVLDKNCLYFSTTNSQNRYIKLINIKSNNNVRDFYLRALELGGQKEEIYQDDDMSAISILLKRLEKNA